MKKLVCIVLVVCLLFSVTTVLAESEDEVDWMLFDIHDLTWTLYVRLGFKPLISISSGSSEKYGVLSIHFYDDVYQRMLKYDDDKTYMSSHDYILMVNGELDKYASIFKDSLIEFYPYETEDGTIYKSEICNATIYPSDSGLMLLSFHNEKGNFYYYLSEYEELLNGKLLISGTEYAQAFYNFQINWN